MGQLQVGVGPFFAYFGPAWGTVATAFLSSFIRGEDFLVLRVEVRLDQRNLGRDLQVDRQFLHRNYGPGGKVDSGASQAQITVHRCGLGYHQPMTKDKIRWGVLSTARIAVRKVIPGMQAGELCEVTAIASRDGSRAREAARELGIAKDYGSYEELLADPEIDAIYNPLPNQFHVPWTAKAAEAGKHVLCEKPLSLTIAEAESLLEVRQRTGVKIGEAFMIRSYTQWLRVSELIHGGRGETGKIGELRAVNAHFSYFNDDGKNIRNQVECGGGALYDIGCYCIQAARVGFRALPRRVVGLIERDPAFGTDRLTSAMLDFAGGQAIFTSSTQLIPYQRVHFFGTKGRVEIEIPFNAPKDRPTRIFIDETGELFGSGIVTEEFPISDQYTMQGDAFSRAILEDTDVPVPLEDAIVNMKVIEAIFESAKNGSWVAIQP